MANDTAMIAKAKARTSNHLKIDDYRNMINMHSVGEIASYLKATPRFRDVLAPVNERAIHREYLEQRIRSQAQLDFNALLKFMKTNHHHFYEFFVMEMEIDHILFVLHAIEAQSKYHLGQFLMHLNHLMSFDVELLAQCTSYEEVLHVLKGSPYEKVLYGLRKDSVDLAKVEDQLHSFYNKTMLELIERESQHQEILDVFKMKLELNDLAHTYRIKKYFNTELNASSISMSHINYKIPKATLDLWIQKADAKEMLQGIQDSYYGNMIEIDESKHIEYSFSMILYKILKKKMRTSNDSDVILFAYMNLVSIEIENLVDVIEGIRYSIPKQEIIDLLIL